MADNSFVEISGQDRDIDALHEIFHENTKLNPLSLALQLGQIRHYLTDPRALRETAANHKRYRGPHIVLPPPLALASSLGEALAARVSFRAYRGDPLSLQTLSTILSGALGSQRSARQPRLPEARLFYRPYPSGGALYPVETYALLLNVSGQPSAVCHYDPLRHRLDLIAHAEVAEICAIAADRSMPLEQAAVILIFSAVFQRSTVKYGARGYRLAVLEAGHATQNVLLCAAAEGLGSLAWAAYFDERVDALLQLDGVNESVVSACILGGSASPPVPEILHVDD